MVDATSYSVSLSSATGGIGPIVTISATPDNGTWPPNIIAYAAGSGMRPETLVPTGTDTLFFYFNATAPGETALNVFIAGLVNTTGPQVFTAVADTPPPVLTETIPDYRTLPTGKTRFSYPKDPQDAAWYAVPYGEPVATVIGVTVTGPDAALVNRAGVSLPNSSGVGLFLEGGTTNAIYGLRIGVTTPGGDTLYRTVLIDIAP